MSKVQMTSSGAVASGAQVQEAEQKIFPFVSLQVSGGPQWEVPKENGALSLEGYTRLMFSKGFSCGEVGGQLFLHQRFGDFMVIAGPHVGMRIIPSLSESPFLVMGGEFGLGKIFPKTKTSLEFYFSADGQDRFTRQNDPSSLFLLGGVRVRR